MPSERGTSTTSIFIVLLLTSCIGIAVLMYVDRTKDPGTGISILNQYSWGVPLPPEDVIRHAVQRVVQPSAYKNRIIQEEALSYGPKCPDRPVKEIPPGQFQAEPDCVGTRVDYSRSKPLTLLTDTSDVKAYRVLAGRIDRTNFAQSPAPDQADYIRYTAKVVVDFDKVDSTWEVGFKTGKDQSKRESKSSEVSITLRWNEKTEQWELP